MRRFDVDYLNCRPPARRLTWDDCLRTLPRRIPRTCRRPVGRARLGRRDLYYPYLLLVRVVFLSISFSPPALLLILRPSFVRYQYNTNTLSPLIQSTASHTPISHVASFISSITLAIYTSPAPFLPLFRMEEPTC